MSLADGLRRLAKAAKDAEHRPVGCTICALADFANQAADELERGGQPPAEPSEEARDAAMERWICAPGDFAPHRMMEALKAAYAVDRPSTELTAEGIAATLERAWDECPDAMLKLDPRVWPFLAKAVVRSLASEGPAEEGE